MGIDLGNLAALRTFRVLRALKTVAIIPGAFYSYGKEKQRKTDMIAVVRPHWSHPFQVWKLLWELWSSRWKICGTSSFWLCFHCPSSHFWACKSTWESWRKSASETSPTTAPSAISLTKTTRPLFLILVRDPESIQSAFTLLFSWSNLAILWVFDSFEHGTWLTM